MFENDIRNVHVIVIEVVIVVCIIQCNASWCERQVYVSMTCCEMMCSCAVEMEIVYVIDVAKVTTTLILTVRVDMFVRCFKPSLNFEVFDRGLQFDRIWRGMP